MNSAQQLDSLFQSMGQVFSPREVLDIPCEVIEEPASAPRLSMLQTLQPVQFTNDDYNTLAKYICNDIFNFEDEDIGVTYEMDSCNLRVWGTVSEIHTKDGAGQPHTLQQIHVEGFECLNEDGGEVATDFDPQAVSFFS